MNECSCLLLTPPCPASIAGLATCSGGEDAIGVHEGGRHVRSIDAIDALDWGDARAGCPAGRVTQSARERWRYRTAPAPPTPVVAVVNGKDITEQELLDRVRGEMSKLEAQMYEVRRNGAEELISDYLLEQTAQSRGLTKDQLMQQEVDSKVSEVTDKEVDNFYAANQARIRKPLDEVRPQILNYLQQNKLTEARRIYLKSLRDKAQVKVYLTPPIVDVSADDAPFKGPASAPITIVEFSDFQCSYCKRVVQRARVRSWSAIQTR